MGCPDEKFRDAIECAISDVEHALYHREGAGHSEGFEVVLGAIKTDLALVLHRTGG